MPVTPAYRKESAKAIPQDTPEAAGIGERAVTCPDMVVARFSTRTIGAARLIALNQNL